MHGLRNGKRWKDFRDHATRPNPATLGLARALDDAKLEPSLVDLVDLLTARLNACAFYPEYRGYVARRGDIHGRKLDAVERSAGDREFSEQERVALQWAEALAQAMRQACATPAFRRMQSRFTLEQAAFLSAAVAAMNVWNRGGMAFQYAPVRAKRVASVS